jgi:tRNA(Ile)-lysidine synthase
MNKRLGGPGYKLVEQARDTIERYLMLSGGETVVVGVSGGPDSMCLLDVLARLHETFTLTLLAAHVDYGIAEASDQVAARVAHHAAEIGYDVHVTRAPDVRGPNLQARAREFRYEFFEVIAQKEGAGAIATAHTLDDRVETLLQRLIHGAPLDVLAGLPPIDGMRIRPLIEARRSETREYCKEVGLEFFDDPANEDDTFERVAVRRRLVRTIEERWGEGAVRAVALAAQRLLEDSRALGSIADRLYADAAKGEGGEVAFDREVIASMPRAFRRRLLERAVGRVRDRHGGIEAALDAIEEAGEDGSIKRFAVASGIEIMLERDKVTVTRPG